MSEFVHFESKTDLNQLGELFYDNIFAAENATRGNRAFMVLNQGAADLCWWTELHR